MLIAVAVAVAWGSITGGMFRSKTRAFAAPITGLSLPGVSSSIPTTDQSVLRPPAINKTLRADQPVSQKQQEEAAQFQALGATPTAQPPAPQDAVVRAASVAPPPDLPPYQVYQVQDGDTVTSIAAKFGIDPKYITANNIEIQDSDFLKLGQSIIIPAGNGVLHEVRYGETLSDIATQYDVTVQDITGFAANHITQADDITETQLVFVPNGKPIEVAPPAAAEPTPGTGGDGGGEGAPPSTSPAPAPAGGIVGGGPQSGRGLIWPVRGPISSYYDSSHPLGIDIDGFNLPGAPIAAALSGTVTFAGGNPCCSYGLYVVVMSPDGIETLYAHMSSVTVTKGQTVQQGEQLGIIGSTGYSTGRHLHFEVIDNGVRQNPLDYLPP